MEEGRKEAERREGEGECFIIVEYRVFLEVTIVLDFQIGK